MNPHPNGEAQQVEITPEQLAAIVRGQIAERVLVWLAKVMKDVAAQSKPPSLLELRSGRSRSNT
jgi:hypothetical protein